MFLELVDDGGGVYIFRTDPEEAEVYEMLKDYIVNNSQQMILNWRQADQADIERYNARVDLSADELPEYFPGA